MFFKLWGKGPSEREMMNSKPFIHNSLSSTTSTNGLKKWILPDTRSKQSAVLTTHKEVTAEKLWPLPSPSFLTPDCSFSASFIARASRALLDFKASPPRWSASVYREESCQCLSWGVQPWELLSVSLEPLPPSYLQASPSPPSQQATHTGVPRVDTLPSPVPHRARHSSH